MGKGVIISGGEAGRYVVQLDYDDARKALVLSRLNAKIDFYQDQLAIETDSHRQGRLKLWIAAAQKRRDFLSMASVCPTDSNITAWCADLTEDLSGDVGTIEIESETEQVLIRPGYEGNAVYSALRDGQMQPLLAQEPAASLLNWMFHDARQKWKPRHRVATIVSVDHDTDTCSLTIDAADGAMTGADVNIMASFTSVPIDYMSCNSAPFEAGDRVVVEFTDNDWAQPVVIGFESNPKGCDHDYVIVTVKARPWDVATNTVYTPVDWCIVWDVGMGCMAGEIEASATHGDFLTFPCKYSDLAYWLSITETRALSTSITWTEFDDMDFATPWEANPGEASYPPGGAGVMCSPMLYDEWVLQDFFYKKWVQDKWRWTSQTNVSGNVCSQRALMAGGRYRYPRSDGKICPGTEVAPMFWMEMNSPLGDFEDFVYDCQLYKWEYWAITTPPDSNLNWYLVPYPLYAHPWWAEDRPTLIPLAAYSGNSHVQIYIHFDRIFRQETNGGGPTPGDPWTTDDRQATKIQIHAAASYHPDPDKTGAINVSPFALSRNASFEDALLDLLETQLKAEDATHGEDWSYWALDEDHSPAWPGPGTTSFFDAACSETYQAPVLYSLSFEMEFREYPEPE